MCNQNNKIKVLFVCWGNICRSPMAQFVFQDLVDKSGKGGDFYIASAGTSSEELGNPVHSGTRRKLAEHGISAAGKTAVQLRKEDYQGYDYIVAMEKLNVRYIERICGKDTQNKVRLLLEFAGENKDIADPWYTGNFDKTYDDVLEGCTALLKYLTIK